MDERRPDPDELLNSVKREEERQKLGKLKIFFGAAPGVGKTYAMLLAARQKKAEGVDVAAGIVETHGRSETEALIKGLEVLPNRSLEYRGSILKEFDIDAALARRPDIILIDELAHTNAPGSRHKKRWKDVFELLDAGINVYATLNVQHLESLNDVVSQITGIIVRETLPDSVLERADEIELIDLPPEELLQRLKEGRVYVAELAVQARSNFFRKGNLLALRELALRRTAEQVDEQMQRYRTGKGVRAVWPASERIMVCVGANPRSIRLIRTAKRMATGLRADWIAVNVEAPSTVKPSESDLQHLAEHMRLAESLGADTATLTGHKASDEILNYARSSNVTKIIIGKPTHPRWKDKIFGSLLDEIVRGSGDIDIYVITGDDAEPVKKNASKVRIQRENLNEWFMSVAIVALCTGIAYITFRYLELVDLAMLYLLAIVIVSTRTGKRPSLLATFLGIAAFDFFFVPPRFTFAVLNVKFVFTFTVMFIVAFIISNMTLRIREQANASRQREKRTAALYNLSSDMVRKQTMEQLCATVIRHISELFNSRPVILVERDEGNLALPAAGFETFPLNQKEMGVAQWVFNHRQEAGLGTDTLQGAEALYLPLLSSSRIVGVLGIMPSSNVFDLEQIHFLKSFANQIAVGIDRVLLAEEAQKALVRAETEALRNTLLSSVSHDMRTPIAAIIGASTALLQENIDVDQQGKKELIITIHEEAEHINHIVRNVLDMTRLEAKAISVKKEWQSIEEIAGAAISCLSERLKGHQLKVDIPEELPLAPFDPLLIQQVLVNLMDNALKYTPDNTSIELSAKVKEDTLLVELADNGPGIPAGNEERIFEKFVRGGGAGGGIGLGLAICRAIIDAHNGRIWAENKHGGGAVFRFTLPIVGKPQMPEPEEKEVGSDG